MATTGQLIRAAREAAGLSQERLAKRLQGVSNSLVSHWEADRRPIADMEALAQALGTTVEALTGTDEAKPKAKPPILIKSAPVPLSAPVPEGDASEGFLNITQARRVFQQLMSQKIQFYSIHSWVQERGLRAYENPLKRNPQGEPTLLFKRSEIEAWLRTQIRPVRAVNQ